MPEQHSSATKRKISLSQRGKKNSFYGKKHTDTAKASMSKKRKGKKNPMYGKSHSEETKRKISLAIKRANRAKKRKK